ncbi:hypothetical protein HAX54_019821 [Datura stramonium]|uniref:Uncharacterized protein n=1 Tax=Datura stramonium TaxID=4076 RepID=A0ABS8UR34_DATST|nr:hypothetical protein [Datura stramonium]
MTNVVNAQSKSLKNLDFHMSYVLNHDETPIIYFDEAFENKEDSYSYCLAITTRSGKILQSELGIAMEEEIHVDEERSQNIKLALRQVIDEASIEEVNEELKVEAPTLL